MKIKFNTFLPLIIGLSIASILYYLTRWWGFLIIFPWIGFSISLGLLIQLNATTKKKGLGRKIANLLILPLLLLFIPIANNENFQMEGIVLLVSIGFFGKGFIHYAVAKIFGPLIWGRGFCGWACWTGSVLDWLPIKNTKPIPQKKRNLRFIAAALSIAFPLVLIFFFSFDVEKDYINKAEMLWMFAGNALYYLIAIPLAFIMKNNRAFCKMVCPVSLVMTPTTAISRIKIAPTENKCIECGKCNSACIMDINVMSYISKGNKVTSTECILCGECKIHCPVQAIK